MFYYHIQIVHFIYVLQGIAADSVLNMVYEQWLIGDLAELEEPFLDKFIDNRGQLTGSHAVQVNTLGELYFGNQYNRLYFCIMFQPGIYIIIVKVQHSVKRKITKQK